MKKLYDWVLGWADTPYGVPALFIFSMAESSFFPIPPDPLLLALGLSRPKKSFLYATVCTVGSVIGGAIGYFIGVFFIESIGMKIIGFYGLADKYSSMQALYEEYNALVILVAGISPIPYKVFTIAAGAFEVSFLTFILASIAGRGFRFYLEGFLIYFFGEPIRTFIEAHMAKLAWAFAALLVLGFVALKFIAQ
ncbi:FIG139438: lipoprotein B [hydrothermal vent metagenome]|uniref:FIG139438: lipoprotein B n=1 Tax=hydrothermal vent metagenome TaxID=652676 RepID=A0A3B1C8U8_9ZZZZ